MFLLDTNIWLELLLKQAKSDEVRRLMETRYGAEFVLTEFSLYSVGIILARLKKDDAFLQFLSDTLEEAAVRVIRLDTEALQDVIAARRKFGLDFDDAYQYVTAEKYNLTLVSFDSDFDRTERGRKTPAEAAMP